MLSILIPVFNFNIVKLATELHKQAADQLIDFEIIVMEDGSKNFIQENKAITALSNIKHIILDKNIGRSAIRNKLADVAAYDYLLFLDCDAKIYSSKFISKYLAFCQDEVVVLGGRIYDENNNDPKFSLIKKYGLKREQNDIENLSTRDKFPMFTTPNFLISKSIFNKIRFDESIKGYGHEDTIFGIMLHEMQIEFTFIDNPVIHIGLENNPVFIQKTEEAIKNLYNLYILNKYPLLEKESKLLSSFILIKKLKLTKALALTYNLCKNPIRLLLCTSNPSLKLFDLYKLLYICKISISE